MIRPGRRRPCSSGSGTASSMTGGSGERVGKPEVRDRLPRRDDGELDLRAGEEAAGPGARRDDAGARHDVVAVGAIRTRAAAELDPRDAAVVEEDGAGVDRACEQRLVGALGQSRAAVRLVEAGSSGCGGDGPALARPASPVRSSWRTPQARERAGVLERRWARSRGRRSARSAARRTPPRARASSAARPARAGRSADRDTRAGRSSTPRGSSPGRDRGSNCSTRTTPRPASRERPCRRDAGDPRADHDDVGVAPHRARS